jgi:hypothetical protein
LLYYRFFHLVEIVANRRHRHAQLVSEREQLNGLVMLKQSAENEDLAFRCRIFECIGLVE